MSHGFLTPEQVDCFSNIHNVRVEKQQKLSLIIVKLSEEIVEEFLQCLESTSHYKLHNSLLNKIRDGKCVIWCVTFSNRAVSIRFVLNKIKG